MAYGPGYEIEGKDGTRYVDKILKEAKPLDILWSSRCGLSW
jgi:putative ABC transport system substrate-binding protein